MNFISELIMRAYLESTYPMLDKNGAPIDRKIMMAKNGAFGTAKLGKIDRKIEKNPRTSRWDWQEMVYKIRKKD